MCLIFSSPQIRAAQEVEAMASGPLEREREEIREIRQRGPVRHYHH